MRVTLNASRVYQIAYIVTRAVAVAVVALLILFLATLVRGAQMADCILDASQTAADPTRFRNDHFALHMGLAPGLDHQRYEYFKPTDYNRTKWMLDLYGESATYIESGGFKYTDLSVAVNRAALLRAIQKRCAAVGADGALWDCIMEVAPGQQWNAADLVREAKRAGHRFVMNFGDGYTWAISDTTTPWGMVQKYSDVQWPQVAINLTDSRYTLRQYVLVVFTAQARLAQGKTVIIGVLDLDGKQGASAAAYFGAPLFNQPRIFGHYSTSYSNKVSPTTQLPHDPAKYPALGINSDLLGQPLYQREDNWWRARIDAAPLDPSSAAIIQTIRSYDTTYGGRFHPDFTPSYGIPYVVVSGAATRVPVAFNYADESDPGPYPVPALAKTSGAYFENGGGSDGDRHLLMLDRDEWILYELSYARWDGAQWTAGAGAIFDLKTNARRPEGWTSTDAAGLAVLSGLVRPDEVLAGRPIQHATRFSVRRTNGHVWPASHTGASDAGAPPLGLRIRLKATYDTSWAPAYLRPLLESWKVYGLILADRGGNCYVQGVMDARWDNATLNPAFHRLKITDFEVIQRGWGKP